MNFTDNIPHNKVKKYKNVKANTYFMKILQNCLNFIGTNVIEPGFKITPQLCLTIIVSYALIISYITMLFTDIPINVKLEATCLMGALFQVMHKLHAAVLYPGQFCDQFNAVHILHAKYQNDPSIAPVLQKIIFYSTLLFECFVISFYGATITYSLLPIFLWKRYGILATIFPIHLPFINWQLPIGYIINTIHHLFFVSVGVLALMTADVIFLYLVLHSIGYLNIFKSCVDKLNETLENEPQHLQKIQTQFYGCIQAHQDYISYIEILDASYSPLCATQLFTSAGCITLSILLTLWRKWIVGPFIALCGLCQVLQYCILGTVATVQNDKASDIIYGMSWYLLPVHLQKLVVLMILRGQSPAELNVGNFAKLNVATCMQILKTIYSYIMMMLEFLA